MSSSSSSSNLLKNLRTAKGRGHELASHLINFYQENTTVGLTNVGHVIPLLFHYNGKPLSMQNHFTMEPLFDLDIPREVTLMCSRQVGKTMNLSARCILNCAWTPHWNILFVAPFFETIRRVSTDYFASLIEQSPAKHVFTDRNCTKQVLERTLPNQSRIRFSYAHRSADRARGIHSRELICDEYQLMFPEVLPVLTATMDASEYGDYIMRAGTPLTNANHLSREFKEHSSRSHWMIKCEACGHHNIASAEQDLLKMIGPMRDDISVDRPGIVCSKCRKPVHPWTGKFVHYNPSKRRDHLGIHVPSIVLPMHCCSPEKWFDLWKILSDTKVPTFTKYNESLGVPYDDGVLLLTIGELDRVAVLNDNQMDQVVPILSRYNGRLAIGVDWGGRGMSGESLTKICLSGLNSDGKIHVLFGVQLPPTATSQDEAAVLNHIFKVSGASRIAHDNLGIGARAEEMMIEKGVPRSAFLPMEYVGETQGQILKPRPRTKDRPRAVMSVDKTRGLLHLIEAIKSQQVLTFRMSEQYHARELLLDLTHLRAEEKVWANSVKSETILIQKEPGQSDDFAHAVHHSCNALWMEYNAWPRLTREVIVRTPQDLSTYVVDLARVLDPETVEALLLKAEDKEAKQT